MFTLESFQFSKKEVEILVGVIYFALQRESNGEQRVGFLSHIFSDGAEIQAQKKNICYRKKLWVEQWSKTVSSLLDIKDLNSPRENTFRELHQLFNEFPEEKKICFVTEVSSFTAYYALTEQDSTEYSNLKFEEVAYLGALSELLANANFDTDIRALQLLRSNFFDCVKDLSKYTAGHSNRWIWMGAGALVLLIAAPYLAGVIGGFMGLSGAAAISAGLAFLGGGSLAAGGFGMMGGYFALMTGGILFGYKFGDSKYKNKLLEISSENLLISGAKLYSAITFSAYRNFSQAMKGELGEVCSTVRMIQFDLEAKIDEISLDGDEKSIVDLRKKSRVLERIRFRLIKVLAT